MVAASSSDTGSSATTFTASSGRISSPNYPKVYSKYNDERYEIIAPSLRTIKLQFLKFDVYELEYTSCGWNNYLRVRASIQISLVYFIGLLCFSDLVLPAKQH